MTPFSPAMPPIEDDTLTHEALNGTKTASAAEIDAKETKLEKDLKVALQTMKATLSAFLVQNGITDPLKHTEAFAVLVGGLSEIVVDLQAKVTRLRQRTEFLTTRVNEKERKVQGTDGNGRPNLAPAGPAPRLPKPPPTPKPAAVATVPVVKNESAPPAALPKPTTTAAALSEQERQARIAEIRARLANGNR